MNLNSSKTSLNKMGLKAQIQSRNEEFFKISAAAIQSIESGSTVLEQQFHDYIREMLVCMFIYCFLYALAYFTINSLRKTKESDDYVLDYEDAIADRVSLWLCTFTLATCLGAVLLLPMSIIANEIIRVAPHSFYWKWLNSSLIYGLWNSIFLFSNLSLFMFLPFAHLFVESIGLPGYKKGIKSRIIETSLLLFLISFCMIGMSFIASAIFDSDNAKSQSLLNISNYHLPFLYSCISFIGVLFLLICTPLGFARLFAVVSNLIMKSTFRDDLKEELEIAEFEHGCIVQRIEDLKKHESRNYELNFETFNKKLSENETLILKLKNESKRSTIYRSLVYPFIMMFLLFLNSFGVLIVAKNTFFVIFGYLPTTKYSSDHSEKLRRIGQNSNSTNMTSMYTFGIVQTCFEIILILYFMMASLVGFYNMPFFNKILPKYKSTPMRKIILNCTILLIFSSALPVSSKILGLTRFDLLGHFGDLHWLANVHIILIYNFAFAIATGICFITKFTATFRSELYKRVLILFQNALMTKSMPTALLINSPNYTRPIVNKTS